MKRKWIKLLATLFMCATLALGFTACEDEGNNSSSSNSTNTEQGSSSDSGASSENNSGDNSSSSAPDSSENNSGDDSSSSDPDSSLGDGSSEQIHTHNYTAETTAPTCTAQGFTTYSCDCGDEYIADYVNALEHDFKDYIPDNNATYTSDGTKTATCSRSGCNEKDTITDVGTKLQSGITFKTLSITGTDAYGKVSNTTETFSFINEVKASGTAKFVVSLDIYGVQQVATKTIPLMIGDNTVYITEIVDDEPINVYTVTVRRRPMYDVTFDTNGGTAVEKQTIEEDFLANEPETTTRVGYTFTAWDYDFTQPITKNTEITAIWTANTNTAYKVEYYLQNLENDNYTLTETVNRAGTTNTTANAEIKTFIHFTHKTSSTDSGNIAPNGSTVLRVYYTRDKYTVVFDANGGTLVSGQQSQTVKYGSTIIAPTYERTGYTFDGFDKTNFENISENFTATAQWKTIPYTITYNLNGGTLEENNNPTSYNVETETFSLSSMPRKLNYGFLGWYNGKEKIEKIEKGTTGSINLVAKWEYALIISGGTLEGIQNCAKTTCYEIEIPSYITKIGKQAFYNNNLLTNIVIPNSVTSIGSDAFNGCTSLTSVVIGNSVTSIGDYAFAYCRSLTSIEIPNSVTSIGDYAFYNCSSLESIEIPNSVTSIGDYAFAYCSSLESIEIPNSVTSIGDMAFYFCNSLTRVTIGDSVTSIGDMAFYFCHSLTSVYYNGTIDDWAQIKFYDSYANPLCYADNLYINNQLVTEAVIATATKINDYAFYNCDSLTSVEIGDSVGSIGSSAFYGCSGLTSVEIGDSVTSIGSSAFCGCSGLTSVEIGDSVTSIGSSAFYNCSSLTSIEIPDSVTSIGSSAFRYCSSLTSIEIPDSVRSIGESAFAYCSSLTSVTIPDSVTKIGYYAFYNCSSLTSVEIPDSVTSIDFSAFENCSRLTSVYITDIASWCNISFGSSSNPLSNGASLYVNNELVTELVIPNTVTGIKSYAFSGYTSLTSVVIPDSVTSIGYEAFAYCSSLTSIEIPDSVTSIGYEAFGYCSSLTSVVIPDSVTSIGAFAFRGCSSLTSITIPDSVTSIGAYAFYYCDSLTSITIPDSVTSIDDDAFDGCINLTSVYYKSTVSDWSNISIDVGNRYLENATRYYYSENEPTTTGNYWHYDENGNIAVW